MEDQYFIQLENEILGEDWLECYATEILDAKYEWTDVSDVVKELHHLDQKQKDDILQVLKKHSFDGTLGVYLHKKFHIDIDPEAKPVYSRPYIRIKSGRRNHRYNVSIIDVHYTNCSTYVFN